ncbi:hypothetical protein SAMN04490185_2920 [Pseudomonas frederiksbergensis]|uniref:Uncharacterized protein n=1 Tax=Pseudomonas frederiksbergensis TaxID=104087 RepID=A0A1H4YJY4_9PSED|nr:hypothetical protein SAMN04490185_2920 [Pseudomonas frederiksbergensis]
MPHNNWGCMKFEAAHDQTFQSPTPRREKPGAGPGFFCSSMSNQ